MAYPFYGFWPLLECDDPKDTPFCSLSPIHNFRLYLLARNYIKHADGISIEWHQEIQDHLKKDHNNRTRCRIGNQLKRLHQVRKKADYENDLKELPFNTASKALSQAEKILDGIKKLQQH